MSRKDSIFGASQMTQWSLVGRRHPGNTRIAFYLGALWWNRQIDAITPVGGWLRYMTTIPRYHAHVICDIIIKYCVGFHSARKAGVRSS